MGHTTFMAPKRIKCRFHDLLALTELAQPLCLGCHRVDLGGLRWFLWRFLEYLICLFQLEVLFGQLYNLITVMINLQL